MVLNAARPERQGNGGRRRFRRPRTDCLRGEEEEDVADLAVAFNPCGEVRDDGDVLDTDGGKRRSSGEEMVASIRESRGGMEREEGEGAGGGGGGAS